MFGKLITIPQFVDDNSSMIFNSINGCRFEDDYTILATLRSLLFTRLEEDQKFNFRKTRWIDGDGIFAPSTQMKDIAEKYLLLGVDRNALHFVRLSINNEKYIEFCNALKNPKTGITSLNSSYTELSDIEEYFNVKYGITVNIFINKADNYAVIVMSEQQIGVSMSHIIASFIPRYFPNLFANHPLLDDEWNLLASLTRRSSADFLSSIAIIADRLDLRQYEIKAMLDGFETRARQTMLDTEKNNLASIESRMDAIMRDYEEYCLRRENTNIKIEGLISLLKKGNKDSEIIKYFIANKCLQLLSVDNRTIRFIVSTHLDNYNADAYQRFAQDGDIYKHYNNTITVFHDEENRKLLLDNLFSETPLLRLRMCCYFYIDLLGSFGSATRYDYGIRYKDFIPNPHFDLHNCPGDNRRYIQEQLKNGNIIGAVQCCIAAAGSVNVLETNMTFRPMLEWIFKSTNKIIETVDGDYLTPEEALKWLKERKEAKEE